MINQNRETNDELFIYQHSCFLAFDGVQVTQSGIKPGGP